ncbi:unnamed protein product [Caenorhabditis brenneri]
MASQKRMLSVVSPFIFAENMAFLVRVLSALFVVVAVINYLIFSWKVSNLDPVTSTWNNRCLVQSWNRIETHSTTTSHWNKFSKWLWSTLNLSNDNLHNNTEFSILSAYVYPDQISISLISQHMVRQAVYCRFYDCERKEIPGSAWRGMVFPESVVECPRRIGAEFVSVSKSLEASAPMPVRLNFRVYEEPIHELSICVAPMYGNQSTWLQITDFIEHNKLEGASFFYFYVGKISPYDERMLNEYVRTGEVEVVKLQDKYERVFIAWQFLEIQDCHLRSKYQSKWTAFIDLDERLSTNGQRMVELLRSIQDPAIGEVQMQSLSVVKDQDYPAKYLGLKHLEKELIFKKYNQTFGPFWQGQKTIIRSDKIGIMSVHAAVTKHPGIKTLLLNSTQAVVRHLRSTKYRVYGSDWHVSPDENGTLPVLQNTPLPEKFSRSLRTAVIKRVLYVYEKVPVNCSTIPKDLWMMIRHPDPCKQMWPYF